MSEASQGTNDQATSQAGQPSGPVLSLVIEQGLSSNEFAETPAAYVIGINTALAQRMQKVAEMIKQYDLDHASFRFLFEVSNHIKYRESSDLAAGNFSYALAQPGDITEETPWEGDRGHMIKVSDGYFCLCFYDKYSDCQYESADVPLPVIGDDGSLSIRGARGFAALPSN